MKGSKNKGIEIYDTIMAAQYVFKLFHYFRKLFPPGAKVVFDGEDFLCEACDNPSTPRISSSEPLNSPVNKVQEAPMQRTPPKEARSEPPPYQTEHINNRMLVQQKEVKGDEDPNCN